jgi:hypothetical protein
MQATTGLGQTILCHLRTPRHQKKSCELMFSGFAGYTVSFDGSPLPRRSIGIVFAADCQVPAFLHPPIYPAAMFESDMKTSAHNLSNLACHFL